MQSEVQHAVKQQEQWEAAFTLSHNPLLSLSKAMKVNNTKTTAQAITIQ